MAKKSNLMVQAKELTKNFSLYANQTEKLQSIFKGNTSENNFWALKGISFDVDAGDVVGIVGTNGSGKSTLLNILSGVIPQTSGELKLHGSIGVVSINEGLNWELTGRENIRLKQLMMGKSNKEITKMMPSIIEFSELGDFIDQPVKDYSNGMRAKLGFSIVTHNDPDILIIDEALSVGDSNFANKALGKIREFIKVGKTIFFVSHDLNQVREFTNKVMWIQYGEMIEFGPTKQVADNYQKFVTKLDAMAPNERGEYITDQKKMQQTFSLDDVKNKLKKEKFSTLEINQITEPKSFQGFSRFGLYGSIAGIIALMSWIIYLYAEGL